jgi:hypothetical protein
LTTSTDGQKIKEVEAPKAKLKERRKVKAKAKAKVKERVKAKIKTEAKVRKASASMKEIMESALSPIAPICIPKDKVARMARDLLLKKLEDRKEEIKERSLSSASLCETRILADAQTSRARTSIPSRSGKRRLARLQRSSRRRTAGLAGRKSSPQAHQAGIHQ